MSTSYGSANRRLHGMRIVTTDELSPEVLAAIKALLETTFDEPFVEDWNHALGGVHFLVEEAGEPIAHTSVVERTLESNGRVLRTGYVEAVATRPDRQRAGLGTAVIEAATAHIRETFELGALGTGEFAFYERFGWERWRGPTGVRTENGLIRTLDEDGFVMILRTQASPADLDVDSLLTCDWRSGDVW